MSKYKPAESGLPKYFLPMLDDADRNVQYGRAIENCIADFIREQGRAPRCLDIGVGTGMLSALCLLHGAEHVTGVDVNATMVQLAKKTLKVQDPKGRRHTVLLVQPGKSQLGDARFDMVVSEILGTLTTSESMYKYVSIYRDHLATFGGAERKVYAVPQRTTQYFSLRAFPRRDLGAPLAAALETGLAGRDVFGRFVPSNEGGLAIHLDLYDSRLVGARHAIHTEDYSSLPASGGFAHWGLAPNSVAYDAAEAFSPADVTLGVLEWEVELWRGVTLRNTLAAYRQMPLRNALARGSAWGFLVTAVPAPAPPKQQLVFRASKLDVAAGKAMPEISIDGVVIGNVCDDPIGCVALAADSELAESMERALGAALGPPPPAPAPSAARERERILIVNDTSCGALPAAAAARGFDVDVVSEQRTASEAAEDACETSLLVGGARGGGGGACSFHVGRVDTTGGTSRKTRGCFVPSDRAAPTYRAILFPSLMMDEARAADSAAARRRVADARSIVDAWLLPGGVRLPQSVRLAETPRHLLRSSLYAEAAPHDCLRLAGVEGALHALGAPCTADEGGALLATNDDGLVFHGLHAVALRPCGARAADDDASAAPPPAKRQRFDGEAAAAAVPPATAMGGATPATIEAGVVECVATLCGKSGLAIEASLPAFQRMVRSGEPRAIRSAVARATYLGVRLRLRRGGPSKARAKA